MKNITTSNFKIRLVCEKKQDFNTDNDTQYNINTMKFISKSFN